MTYIPKYKVAFTIRRIKDLAKRKSHSEHEVAREVVSLFSILSSIPKWKAWHWLPIVVKLSFAIDKHSKCCPNLKDL